MNKRRTAWAAGAALCLALTGCTSGQPGGEGVAALPSTSGATAAPAPAPNSNDNLADQAAEFAGCMRENGVDMPDPQVDGDGGVQMRLPAGAKPMAEDDDFAKADKACASLRPTMGGQLSDEDRSKMQEGMLAFAQCMRAEGVDVPDPKFEADGRVVMGPPPAGVSDAEFGAAESTCKKHLVPAPGAQSNESGGAQ